MNDQFDYNAIRARVDRKIKHQRLFFAHMLVFLLFMGVATTGIFSGPLLGIVLIGWAALLAVHQLYVNSIGKREAEIEQEVQREKTRLAMNAEVEKPKRGERLVLGEDGELLEVVEDDSFEDEKPKRGQSSL